MKKILNIGFIALLCALISVAVVSEVKGNHEGSAVTSVLAIGLSVVKGAGVSTATQVFGLQKTYFSEMETNPLSRAEKELWGHLMSNASEQTKADLNKGKLKIEKYARSLKFTIPISTGGRRELLNAATIYSQGAIPQEWHQGQLPGGCTLAISHVGVAFASDAANATPQADIDYGTVVNSWPSALRNAELIFSQEGSKLGGALDCEFMGSKAAGFQSSVESDGLELDKPMILVEKKPTMIELYCPLNVTFAATPAYQYVAVMLLGVWVRPRN
jgi:hypothetical protein